MPTPERYFSTEWPERCFNHVWRAHPPWFALALSLRGIIFTGIRVQAACSCIPRCISTPEKRGNRKLGVLDRYLSGLPTTHPSLTMSALSNVFRADESVHSKGVFRIP